ncbi:MAG: erythrose-4-phosphate dehydrogenase [Chromatiaceae bacterium]|nr:erythrose-4-phosphate dehydrogenase [Chromatiaceae bacterium]
MRHKVAINGFGRIGRCILRALFESDLYRSKVQIVAINELADIEKVIHLTRYDTTHGRFSGRISQESDSMVVNGERISILSEPNPERLPWRALGVDLVLECTGVFRSRTDAGLHIAGGAQRVLFSHPAEADVDATIVFGINHHQLTRDHRIVSNASCTTNGIIPVLSTLDQHLVIDCAMITTIHSAMHDQPVIDAYDKDLRKTRSALQSIIPVQTELAKGIERILPELSGKVTAQAIRVPTINVSMMDLTARVQRACSNEQVNDLLRSAAQLNQGRVLGFSDELLVSIDFNHDPRSSIIDANQTQVCHQCLVKVVTWFDNEWGFANRMLDTAIAMMEA